MGRMVRGALRPPGVLWAVGSWPRGAGTALRHRLPTVVPILGIPQPGLEVAPRQRQPWKGTGSPSRCVLQDVIKALGSAELSSSAALASGSSPHGANSHKLHKKGVARSSGSLQRGHRTFGLHPTISMG